MRAAETLEAYEAGLITESEAIEQSLADDLDDLYVRASEYRDRRRGSRQGAAERRLSA